MAERDRESVTREREDLFNQLVGLERRYSECEQREVLLYDFFATFFEALLLQNHAIQGLQRAIAAAEEAKLQREQATIREQQTTRDLTRLSERLAALPNELKDHYTKEI